MLYSKYLPMKWISNISCWSPILRKVNYRKIHHAGSQIPNAFKHKPQSPLLGCTLFASQGARKQVSRHSLQFRSSHPIVVVFVVRCQLRNEGNPSQIQHHRVIKSSKFEHNGDGTTHFAASPTWKPIYFSSFVTALKAFCFIKNSMLWRNIYVGRAW